MKIKEEYRKCKYCKHAKPVYDHFGDFSINKIICHEIEGTIPTFSQDQCCANLQIGKLYEDEAYED